MPEHSTQHVAGEPEQRLTLGEVRSGATVRVAGVVGGRRLIERLAALGLVPGARLTVERPRGPTLISLHGARIALGPTAAQAVAVEDDA